MRATMRRGIAEVLDEHALEIREVEGIEGRRVEHPDHHLVLGEEISDRRRLRGQPAQGIHLAGIRGDGLPHGPARRFVLSALVVDDSEGEQGLGGPVARIDGAAGVVHGGESLPLVEDAQIAVEMREQTERLLLRRSAPQLPGQLEDSVERGVALAHGAGAERAIEALYRRACFTSPRHGHRAEIERVQMIRLPAQHGREYPHRLGCLAPLESELAQRDLGLDRGGHQGQGGLRSSLRLVLMTRAQRPEAGGVVRVPQLDLALLADPIRPGGVPIVARQVEHERTGAGDLDEVSVQLMDTPRSRSARGERVRRRR